MYPQAHKLFPPADSADSDEDDLRIAYIMRNLQRILPEEDAARLNRIFARMENVFLVLDQPAPAIALIPPPPSAAAVTAAQLAGTRGSIQADVLSIDSADP